MCLANAFSLLSNLWHSFLFVLFLSLLSLHLSNCLSFSLSVSTSFLFTVCFPLSHWHSCTHTLSAFFSLIFLAHRRTEMELYGSLPRRYTPQSALLCTPLLFVSKSCSNSLCLSPFLIHTRSHQACLTYLFLEDSYVFNKRKYNLINLRWAKVNFT